MPKLNMNKLLLLTLVSLMFTSLVIAQVDSGMFRFLSANYPTELYATDMSGDGRFIVMESDVNIATHNPRNADRNREIFLLDVAQRHIFQITNTKSALIDPNGSSTANANIRVLMSNSRPSISNNGRWIAFGSNATTSTPTLPNSTNPGNFDGNSSGTPEILVQDGNKEIWLYQLPAYQDVDLALGDTPPFVDLAAGTFIRGTNTPPSRYPQPGTSTTTPFVADDNHDCSVDDDGITVAFGSTRDIVPGGNTFPNDDNDEIFIFKRVTNSFAQVTRTIRGPISNPIYNSNPMISGNGLRVAFVSTGTNPVIGMSGGTNPENNSEVHFSDLNGFGESSGTKRQITVTAPLSLGDPVNIFYLGRNISRDGRYIAFESYARLDTANGVGSGAALFVYDANIVSPSNPFRRVGPYDGEDSGLTEFDVRFPRFADYNPTTLTPNTLLLTSRINFRADGTVPPSGSGGGLNPEPLRPSQVYSFDLTNGSASFKRISNSQSIAGIERNRCFSGDSKIRIACVTTNVQGEQAILSIDNLLTPIITQEDSTLLQFFTGAGLMSVGSGSPLVQGLMPNMLGTIKFLSPLPPQTSGYAANVSNSRNPAAPIQFKGVSLTVDGVSARITGILQGQVNFIVPPGITPGTKPVVLNHNGFVLRGSVPIIQTPQPDVVTNFTETLPQANGRARVFNVTDPQNPFSEPFRITTQTPNGPMPTKLRISLTGVEGVTADAISMRIGSITVPTSSISTNAVQTDYPGVFTFDFLLPTQLDGAGNVPVVVTINGASSRPDDTAPRVNILSTQQVPTDLAVWRPSEGTWWVLGGPGSQQTVQQWGLTGDVPVPGDYDGDGKTDFSVFRPSSSNWYLVKSSTGGTVQFPFGQSGDKAAPADYDGDGKTDVAIFRPSNGVWYILRSSDAGVTYQQFGLSADTPAPADYDGDGKADITVLRGGSPATFYILRSSDAQAQIINFGQAGDVPVSADYDGDGKADIATWRDSNGNWYIRQSTTGTDTTTQWGLANDKPVPNDYDGDGKVDLATWRDSNGNWYIRQSASNNSLRDVHWGQSGDIPVPAFYRR